MNKFKQAAIDVLSEAKKLLYYKEITRIAIENGFLETDGETPELTMYSQLSVEINKLGKASYFIKVEKSIYVENFIFFQIFKYGSKLAKTSISINNWFDISSVAPTATKTSLSRD